MELEGERAYRRKLASAVARRLPQHEFAIHELMERRECFRDMCEELLAAEMALSRVADVPLLQREARRSEWQACVERSLGEIEAEVRKR
ncbi:hypothetical protein AJ88_27695 [Mesorhizobium amorphae CCBAU 01583]|nr:hypothetical protein AJ88_27695 [Mesorhizobium amorphae CCBAU 01583]